MTDIYFLMEDTTTCPICGSEMRTLSVNIKLHYVEKVGDFFERTCTGPNHSVQFYADKLTKSVDMLKFSLDPKYSRFLEIDYLNKRCRIYCVKNSEIKYIYINKMLIPDFPDLKKLTEIISLYVIFS
jgi:hypothetical protein